ncbi:MAG TPA: porin [Acidovorax sp.]|jgi:predicted porin|nr:porin [Acidovorax sp.]
MTLINKTLIAGAALLAVAGSAQAQSNVTLFGRADASVGKLIGNSQTGMYQGKGSLLGLKGEEDLGGGNYAFFQLYSDIFLQNGTTLNGDGQSGRAGFWGSRSIVGWRNKELLIDFGRKLTPAWTVGLQADPWGTYSYVAVNTTGLFGAGLFSSARNQNAASVNWNSDGFFAGLQVAEADPKKVVTRGGGPNPVPNMPSIVADGTRPLSIGAGYNKGPVYVGLGYERTGYGTTALMFSGTYDFSAVKLWVGLGSGSHTNASGEKDLKGTNMLIGATVPMGIGELRTSFSALSTKARNASGGYDVLKVARDGQMVDAYPNNSRKFGLGYFYPLSKRTEVFVNYARDQKAYKEKNGFDMGLTHHF